MSFYLATKEIWRQRSRFILFSLVIALITILVLFIAALAAGLATANRQFLEKMDADMLIFQENVDLQTTSSRIDQDTLREIRRVDGVSAAGPLGFSTGALLPSAGDPVDVSLVGIEPGQPGTPALLSGPGLLSQREDSVIIDESLAEQASLKIGDHLTLKTIQGTEEEFFELKIAGITDQRQYFFQPSVILPMETWERVRPQPAERSSSSGLVYNVIAIQLENPVQYEEVKRRLVSRVDRIEVSDKAAAIQAIPGYSAQQSTLNTQQGFTLLIGVLVVGGFFQIQTLQKVAQIGMLKAIGSPNRTVASAALLQITFVTLVGVLLGSLGTLLLAFGLPSNIPILFAGPAVAGALAALVLIGPIGGLVSIRMALKIDPLTAIGLSS